MNLSCKCRIISCLPAVLFLLFFQGYHAYGQEALEKKLADELKGIGITLNTREVDSIAKLIEKGGTGAVAIAQFIVASIAELESNSISGKERSSKNSSYTPNAEQLDSLLMKLKKEKGGQDLSRYISTKISEFKKQQLQKKILPTNKDPKKNFSAFYRSTKSSSFPNVSRVYKADRNPTVITTIPVTHAPVI